MFHSRESGVSGNFRGRIKGAKYRFPLQDGTWDFPGDAVAGKGQSPRKAMPKKAQTTAQLHSSHMLVREGNGTPLQYSCLENPMDGGAWFPRPSRPLLGCLNRWPCPWNQGARCSWRGLLGAFQLVQPCGRTQVPRPCRRQACLDSQQG